jgi:hypothetical protein
MNSDIESIKEYIQSSIKISELLDSYEMTYKQVSPTRLKMCCPFHDEDTPSMVVYLETNSFHCFGCAKNGNSITFLMYYHGKTFSEILDMFKDKATLGDALVLDRVDKSLETKTMDLMKYIRSNKYSLGVFLRNILNKNKDSWSEIDSLHREMDIFFDNEVSLDKKMVDEFIDSIIGRATK